MCLLFKGNSFSLESQSNVTVLCMTLLMAQTPYKAGLQYMLNFFAQRNDQFIRYDGTDLFALQTTLYCCSCKYY